jgi:signal transduction histidine kinase/CheY-like chemotaxis protein
MLTALPRDGFVRVTTALWLAGVLLYVIPGVPAEWREQFGLRYFPLTTYTPIVIAAFVGLGRIPEATERRFWTLIGTAFLCWLAVSLPYLFVEDEEWTHHLSIAAEFGYVLFYSFFALAVELRPHEQHTGSVAETERRLRTAGVTLFAFFLLCYFALVPASFAPDVYETAIPSFYMYLLLDGYLLGRLLWMRRDTWSVRWTMLYAWLAASAGVVMVGDIVEFAAYRFDDSILNPGSMRDHIWTIPGVLFVIAIRARHVPLAAELRVLNEPRPGLRTLRAGHILLMSALALPFIHLMGYASGLFGNAASRPVRDMVSVLSMCSLGGFAISAYRALERERSAMQQTETRLLSELGVARKMDAVARLSGSVAHDFNNLVQVVRGRAEIIAQQISTESPIHEDVRQIRVAASRAADLASQLMTFGRKQMATLSTVSLHDVVRRTEKLLKPLLDERTRLELDLRAESDVVRIDPLQFERIVLNLATNARDAMPNGGTLTIATSTPTDSRFAPGGTQRITLRVSDTGTGMDAETVSHIFEPFFTTKRDRGAGLGLAIVHGLIQQFGGNIRVDSAPGEGTTFTISLPLITDTPASALSAPTAGREAQPGAILIVDGDTTNRQFLRRLFADLDRPVLATATSAEAIQIADRYAHPIGVAVIDISIDGGRTLAGRLRESRTTLRAVLLAQDQPIDAGPLDAVLREPFELSDVLEQAAVLLKHEQAD